MWVCLFQHYNIYLRGFISLSHIPPGIAECHPDLQLRGICSYSTFLIHWIDTANLKLNILSQSSSIFQSRKLITSSSCLQNGSERLSDAHLMPYIAKIRRHAVFVQKNVEKSVFNWRLLCKFSKFQTLYSVLSNVFRSTQRNWHVKHLMGLHKETWWDFERFCSLYKPLHI